MKGFFKDRTRIVILISTLLIALLTAIESLRDNETGIFASVGEWVHWVRLALCFLFPLAIIVMMGIQARNNYKQKE